MVSALVLAAGSSRRMGSINKMMLTYKNKPLVAHVVENILAAEIEDIIVVGGFEAERVKEALKDLPVHFVVNEQHDAGLTGSIQLGVRHASGNGFMVCLADMVLIEPGEYFLLVKSFEEQASLNTQCICVPVYDNRIGNPVIFSSFYRQAILDHADPEGCKAIVQANKKNVFLTTMNTDHILQDIDYPGDVKILQM